MTADLQTIRRAVKRARQQLSKRERRIAERNLNRNLLSLRTLHRSSRVAVYMPFRGEANCLPMLDSQKLRKKRIFLPVLQKNYLRFAAFFSGSGMHPNRFGILEPVYSRRRCRAGRDMDVVFTPLVAFDNRCNRIGMGAGFYDRSFAFRKRRKKWRRPLLVGVAYDFQRVDQIPVQPWDVPLDIVVTDQKIYKSSSTRAANPD